MGIAYISEYTIEGIGKDSSGNVVQSVVEPALVETAKSYAGATLHTLNAKTVRVRIYTDSYLEFLVGTSTVDAKVSQGKPIPGGQTEYFDIAKGQGYISLYDGTT